MSNEELNQAAAPRNGRQPLPFTAELRFYAGLNAFLPRQHQRHSFSIASPAARSVKDLIESVGVPHTEIDLVRELPPFSRCLSCNGRLQSVSKEAVRRLVPPRTWQYVDTYLQCGDCAKVYWKGAHWSRLEYFVRSVAGSNGSR